MIPANSKIVIASGNKGKLREFAELLANFKLVGIPQTDFDIPSPEETGLSFVENAIIKARFASDKTGLPSLADDSGIEVDALHGAPGIYSARYAGTDADDSQNNAILLAKLKDLPLPERTARYRCVIVLMHHGNDPTPLICQGSWEGKIGFEPKGKSGFGYDPLFLPTGKTCTAAELNANEKNRISHRAIAMQNLLKELKLETKKT